MKRTLLASLVAASLAAPATAAPTSLLDDLLAGALPVLEDHLLQRDFLASADEAHAQAEKIRRWSQDFTHELRQNLTTMYGPRLSASKVVKNAPYSADVLTETNQGLADGNVITHKSVGAIHRDAEGRTRQESAGTGKKPGTIYINDPVDAKQIVLVPGAKKAIVTARPASIAHAFVSRDKHRQVIKMGSSEIRLEDGKVFVDGKEVPDGKVEMKSGGRELRIENGRVTVDGKDVSREHPRVVVRTATEKQEADGTRREEVRVQVIRSGDKDITIAMPPLPPVPPVPPVPPAPPMASLPPMPGIETLRFESTARLGKGVTTQLGTKDFDGVRAEGKSTVWTIPAGEIGNRNPIQVTSESWHSPDLQVTVYARYHDPRTGESIYRLSNIRRAEPPRELFTVPDGYDTKDRSKGAERR
jgi:hypothetical protein